MKRILLVMLVSMLPSLAYLQPWGKNYGDGLNFDQLVSRFEAYWSDKKPEKARDIRPSEGGNTTGSPACWKTGLFRKPIDPSRPFRIF